MVEFVTLFLGLTLGVERVEVLAPPTAVTVELLLNGKVVARREEPPWVLRCDFGDIPEPHELVAIARDWEGGALGRAVQQVNVPKPALEATLTVEETGDGKVGRLRWSSLEGGQPRHLEVSLDGEPFAVEDPDEFPLPPHDPEELHFLQAELELEQLATRLEVVFGGEFGDVTDTDLTALVVEMDRRRHRLGPAQLAGAITRDGRPLSVVAVERGPAEIVVVRDASFPVAGSAPPGVETWPADLRIRFLWPVSHRQVGAHQRYDLFPTSQPFRSYDGGLSWLLTRLPRPAEVGGSDRLADAVAIAGLTAVERRSRRAVVLVLGEEPQDHGTLSAPSARHFLAHLGVPLFVWSVRPDTAPRGWGEVVDISTPQRLRAAGRRLEAALARQRTVWLAGLHRQVDVELRDDVVEGLLGKAGREPAVAVRDEPLEPTPTVVAVSDADALVAQIDQHRQAHGVDALSRVSALDRVACRRAAELVGAPQLLRDEAWRARLVGELLEERYPVRAWPGARELIAIGPGSDASVLDAWVKDPASRTDLLERGLVDVGACAAGSGAAPSYRVVVLSRAGQP